MLILRLKYNAWIETAKNVESSKSKVSRCENGDGESRRVFNEIEIDEPLTWNGTRRIVSRERRAKRKKTEEKINQTTDWGEEEGKR